MNLFNKLNFNKVEKILKFNDPPYIMGILNVTPDSFSDGGDFFSKEKAIEHALKLIADGADIIDVGGESTRPFSEPISSEEEIKRVIPVIKGLKEKSDCILSLDTYKAKVAESGLKNGVDIINDISGLSFDPEMADLVASYNVSVVIMHMKGSPKDMQISPFYDNLWEELMSFFHERINFSLKKGIDKIILDPGIGFGKRVEDNINIIKGLKRLKTFGYPILIGNSRKSFLGKISGIENPKDRDLASIVADIISILNGADIIRSHNAKLAKESLNICKALI